MHRSDQAAGATTPAAITELAHQRLGYDGLRPGQAEAVEAVCAGRDVLAVMPTGSGKSAIFVLAGLIAGGPVVVVSPLIALQHDQVESVDAAGVGRACAVNSTMGVAGRREALERAAAGDLDFVYLSPEQLANDETVTAVAAGRPRLFVVDEAHCVSAWGHDFRPDYLHLATAARVLGRPPVLALTATAPPPVRDEIVRQLEMVDPLVVVRGFDRPNIHLAVEMHTDAGDKRAALLDWIASVPGPGIVYAATRRETGELAAAARERGLRAEAYHGGLAAGPRQEVQDAFMGDGLDVVVATTAFGMGVDKAHVAYVAHMEISDSVDSYYQEIGRAGRDGEAAAARLFYRPEDLGLRRFFASGGDVTGADLEAVAEVLQEGPTGGQGVGSGEVAERAGVGEGPARGALQRLAETGWARRLTHGAYEAAVPDGSDGADPGEAAAETAAAQEAARRLQRSRVEMMRGYAETRSCRREYLLGYFGEPYTGPCGNCDNCDEGRTREPADPEVTGRYPVGSRVVHAEWGDGAVVRVGDGDHLTVLFDQAGYRTLSLALLDEGHLLRSAQDAPPSPPGYTGDRDD